MRISNQRVYGYEGFVWWEYRAEANGVFTRWYSSMTYYTQAEAWAAMDAHINSL